MKKYLADLLTLLRLIISLVLLAMAFFGGEIGIAFILFILGELTDAFDGTCATKWPFPKNHTPKYRKYAAKYDMFTDILLIVAMMLFFLMRVNLVVGLTVGVSYGILALIIDLIVYGKIMGHPDDAKPNSLMLKNFPLAKKIILARRALYIFIIVLISAWTLYATSWPTSIKIAILLASLIISIFLWFFLAQRRHNISRDAVDIEKKLSKPRK